MQAVVYHAPGDIRIEDIRKPVPGPGELLVRIDACAVCGTDLKSRKHGNPRIKAPLVMGHEFTGIVVEGRGARDEGRDAESVECGVRSVEGIETRCERREAREKNLTSHLSPLAPRPSPLVPRPGDRVVMATSVSCGQCYYCRCGWRNLCDNLAPMGFSYPGGMAEYVVIPALALEGGHAVKVPPHVDAKHAALAEPVSCAVNSVRMCDVQPGDTVLVMGAGPMGLLNALVARAAGASRILLSEPNVMRRTQASSFDLDRIIDPETEDITKIVRDATDGHGADVVIVAAPAVAPQEQAISLVRKHGTVNLFASLPVGGCTLNIDSRILHYGEIRLIGSSDSTPEHVHEAVAMIAGQKIPADKIVSHCLPLDQIEQAFELMQSGEALRVVLLCP